MTAGKGTRLSKIAREFNVGISTIVEFLIKKGYEVDTNPNTKIAEDIYDILIEEYSTDISAKKESDRLSLKNLREEKETISIHDIDQQRPLQPEMEEEVFIMDPSAKGSIDLPEEKKEKEKEKEKEEKTTPVKKSADKAPETTVAEEEEKIGKEVKVVGKIDLSKVSAKGKRSPVEKVEKKKEEKTVKKTKKAESKEEEVKTVPEPEPPSKKADAKPVEDENFIKTKIEKITGPSVVGKIDLPVEDKEKKAAEKDALKKRRKRIRKDTGRVDISNRPDRKIADKTKSPKKQTGKKRKRLLKPEVSEEDVQKQVKETLARLTDRGKSKAAKYRREKRDAASQKIQEEEKKALEDSNILKVTEFVSVQELASMMDVPATEVIATCMDLGMLVSINQRLDAETLSLVADEFNYKVEFISVEVQEAIAEIEDETIDAGSITFAAQR